MRGESQSPILNQAKLSAIRSLFKGLPDGFDERHAALKAIRDEFHTELARNFETILNEYAQLLPQDTYDEKRKTASMINGLLRSVGLTIRNDNGQAALLVVDTLGDADPNVSRFRLEWRDDEGRVRRTGTKQYLQELTLMQEHPRQDFWAKRMRREPPDRER
ncbi:MAG: hypothetical protein KF841_15200 [Phycisphaerae bacterium]|nr:hypothetical protein [Phycisphaerae bacterium]